MLDAKMEQALNDQLNAEMASGYLYLSMATYFEDKDLPGFGHSLRLHAEEELELAKKFVQYCFTDAKNKEYTQMTGVPRAFEYNFNAEEYKNLSSFGQSLWDMVKSGNATILYPQSKNSYYLDKVKTLQPGSFFATKINNSQYNNMQFDSIQEVIQEKNISPETAFRGIYEYQKDRY
jgi:hypothetical protein